MPTDALLVRNEFIYLLPGQQRHRRRRRRPQSLVRTRRPGLPPSRANTVMERRGRPEQAGRLLRTDSKQGHGIQGQGQDYAGD